jgi:hypothetical protein
VPSFLLSGYAARRKIAKVAMARETGGRLVLDVAPRMGLQRNGEARFEPGNRYASSKSAL